MLNKLRNLREYFCKCFRETVSLTQLLKGQSLFSAGRLKLGKETLATIDGHWDDRVMWKVRSCLPDGSG
jgi:hypothetical protein